MRDHLVQSFGPRRESVFRQTSTLLSPRGARPRAPGPREARAVWLAVAIAVAVGASGCPGPASRPPAGGVTGDGPPAPRRDFTPGPPLLDPAPPDPGQFGLAYLQQLRPRLAEPWATFLDNCRLYFPPGHALNDAKLAARIAITIASDGDLVNAAFVDRSGNADFDQAALEIVRDAAPFPPPDRAHISDDDAVHVDWLFARDRRQAGVATATLSRVEWPAERAVPKLLAAGDITAAARRLAAAIAQAPAAGRGAGLVDLGRQLAEAAIREALRAEDPSAQRAGVAAAADAKLLVAAPDLRAIVDSSVDIALRGDAIAALGAVGDEGAAQLLVTVLETAKGSGVGGAIDNGGAAARALAAIGRGQVAEATIQGWLEAGEPESLWAALVVMAEFPVPASAPALATLVTRGAPGPGSTPADDRRIRVAACSALGTATRAASVTVGLRGLIRGMGSRDAAIRAACARALAAAAERGVRGRAAYWKASELMKDRDERVRAGAVAAAARLEPARFSDEMYILRKERSPLVLAAMAEGLARVPGATAYAKLVALARTDDPAILRPALASLLARDEPGAVAIVAGHVGDSDPRARQIAIRAVTDPAALRALLADPSPEIQFAALRTLVRRQGAQATLGDLAGHLASAARASAARARLAHAWLVR